MPRRPGQDTQLPPMATTEVGYPLRAGASAQRGAHVGQLLPRAIRTKQILRFRHCQQRRRAWIGLWDIADWIACERGRTERRDEQLRQQGYRDLLDAMRHGEFDRRGVSLVLHLSSHPDAERNRGHLRLGQECLERWVRYYAGTDLLIEQVLPRCFVPRALARSWFDRRGIAWPVAFDPMSASRAASDEGIPFSGKRTRPSSRLKAFWPEAEAEIMKWLDENGCPADRDGNQTKLECVTIEDILNKRGWKAAPSTVRRHVRGCIERQRNKLGR
jgi:hypothetical protein